MHAIARPIDCRTTTIEQSKDSLGLKCFLISKLLSLGDLQKGRSGVLLDFFETHLGIERRSQT